MLRYDGNDFIWLLSWVSGNYVFYLGNSFIYHYFVYNVMALITMTAVGLLRYRLHKEKQK